MAVTSDKFLYKEDLAENVILHTSLENGLSPVCVRMYLFKLGCAENADLYTLKETVFSSVCLHMLLQSKLVWKGWFTYFKRKWFHPVAYSHECFLKLRNWKM